MKENEIEWKKVISNFFTTNFEMRARDFKNSLELSIINFFSKLSSEPRILSVVLT
jgi:hypothetical protein